MIFNLYKYIKPKLWYQYLIITCNITDSLSNHIIEQTVETIAWKLN